jgi:hypothetical protein
MPAFGIIMAGMIIHLRLRWMRYSITALVVVAAVTMTMQVESSRWRIPGLASSYEVNTSFGAAYVQLSRGLGPAYNYLPSDYAANMLDYLASVSKSPRGVVQPRTIAILELQGYVNGNTMPYEAALRGLPFTFVTLFSDGSPSQTAALTAQLKTVNFALYLTQPNADLQSALGRVAELNNTAAAAHMTPAMFALFEPNPHGVYVGEDSGQGSTMDVLVRKR